MTEDFTFELKTGPGQYSLRATVAATLTTSGQAGAGGTSGAGGGGGNLWAVKSVRLGGRDVTDSGITVSAEEVNGLEIELTNRTTQITGQVTDARGIVKDYVTLLFSQDRKRWTQAGDRYFRVGRPGQDGRFKVTTLPPGDYYGIALDRADPGEFQDPEFLESLSRQASTFSLTEGETRTVDLRLFTLQ